MKNVNRIVRILVLLGGVLPLAAQLPDNASLHGSYYVRYLGADTSNAHIMLGLETFISFHGIMTFDGTTDGNGLGRYSLTGQGASTGTSDHSLSFATSGQYQVVSSGGVQMRNPFDPSDNAWLYGGMSDAGGIVIQSSGETPFIDFFIAIPVSTAASNATLNGTYYLASMDLPNGDSTLVRNAFFPVTADGNGNLGSVTVKGTALNLNNAATTQVSTGATYSIQSDGSGSLNLPPPGGVADGSQLVESSQVLYVSPDGNFFISGTAGGYDLTMGVKQFSGASPNGSFQGIYWKTAFASDNSNRRGSTYGFSSLTGSTNEVSSLKLEMGDEQRTVEGGGSDDLTYQQSLEIGSEGTQSDAANYRALGPNGSILIGAGTGGHGIYGLGIHIKAPAMKGSGVFLNPQGIVNAASSAPFTANLAPGEFIALYGSGLSSQTVTASALPFPATLGGVQVTVNGEPMPLYYVSPTQILAILPYSAPAGNGIQVINNGVPSNPVQMPVGNTAPGVFTVPPGGVGTGAIEHACDPQSGTPCDAAHLLVTSDNPAKPGETVIMYLTGLGAVSPAVPAGAAGPVSPLSNVSDRKLAIYIDGQPATIQFAGLAPGFAGLYQVNMTLPASGLSDGAMEIDTVDSINSTIRIPISH